MTVIREGRAPRPPRGHRSARSDPPHRRAQRARAARTGCSRRRTGSPTATSSTSSTPTTRPPASSAPPRTTATSPTSTSSGAPARAPSTSSSPPRPTTRGSWASRDEEHIDGIARGIDDARDEAGIEGRILISCVRNFGVEAALQGGPLRRRAPAPVHRRLLDGRRRGELPRRRLRRGVRDRRRRRPRLHRPRRRVGGPGERAGRRSSCRSPASPTGSARSRIPRSSTSSRSAASSSSAAPRATSCSGIYPSYEEHPLPRLRDAGVRITLGSDDPPYFGASIGGEYEICREHFGYGDDDLRAITETAIDAAFCEETLKERVKAKRCRVAQSLTQRGDSTVRKSFRFTLFALLAALALGIAACGGDDDSGGSSSSTHQQRRRASRSRPASSPTSAA